MTSGMVIYAAMQSGLDYDTIMELPKSLVEDIIASHQILSMEYRRIYTDEKDIEDDFLRTMSAR